MTTTFTVSTEAELNQAIATVDELSASGDYVIVLAADIKLGTDLNSSSTYAGQLISNPAELFAINLHNGATLTIDGQGHKIDGSSGQYSYYRGLFVYSGHVAVHDLTVANTKALGSTGYDGGGGGAGLGGGLLIANDSAHGAAPGDVTLSNVVFLNNNATGGGVTYSSAPHATAGGGGGLGGIDGFSSVNGAADNGGGGAGSRASGGSDGGPAGGIGIILGAGSGGAGATTPGVAGSGAPGGLYGGGGGATNHTNTDVIIEAAGGGGGVGGAAAVDEAHGGAGGFGGGGGERANGGFGGGGGEGGSDYNHDGVTATASVGGNGGFGGGGGGSSVQGGQGGFGAANGSSTQHYVGGAGLGAGGAIFVQQGASLTFTGSGGVSGGSVANGGGSGSTAKALGSGIFLQGNETITFSAAAGQTITVSDDIADQTGSGGVGANAGVGSVIIAGGGTVALTGNNTFVGGVTVQAGASFTGNAGSGGVTAGAGGLIRILSVDGQGNAQNLGSGVLKLNGGGVEDDANSYAMLTNALVVGASGGSLLPNGQFLSLSGALSGSGALTIGAPGGSGTVTLNADESAFTGSITVSAGNVLARGANTVFSGQTRLTLSSAAGLDLQGGSLALGSLSDAGAGGSGYVYNFSSSMATLTVGADGTSTTFAGTIGRSYSSGDPDQIALRKLGAGVLTLKGTDVLPGGVVIDGGTLQIGDGSGSLGAFTTPTIVDNAALVYNTGFFNVTVASAISGTGTLTKLGTGTLILTGADTLTGAVTVSGGSLSVEGTLAAPVTIASGAVLEGHGKVGAVTIQTGGRLAPGGANGGSGASSAAILNTGSISFGAGTYWSEELNGYNAGTYDALNVTGTVNLGGVTLTLLTSNGFTNVSLGTTFTLINNDGADSVVGAFANQNSGGDILRTFFYSQSNPSLSYSYTQAYHVNTSGGDGNDVTLTMINTQPTASNAASGFSVDNTATLAFSGSANRFNIGDADEGSQQTLTTTITVAHGTLRADGWFSGEGGATLTLANFSASSTNSHIGSLVYTPNAGFVGSDTITVTVRDNSGASNDTMVKTLQITVSGQANHAPTLTAGTASATLVEASPVSSGVAASLVQLTASDPDGTTPTYVTAGLTAIGGGLYQKAGAYGVFTLNTATGQVAYALDNHSAATLGLAAGAVATDSATFSVTDGSLSATATATFTVTGADQNATGDGSDEVFTSTGANNVIDGGGGVDTVVFSGASSSYLRVLNSDGSLTVVDQRSGSPDGTDTLRNIEQLRFTNGAISALPAPTIHDLGLDGRADLVWRSSDGQVRDWVLNGASVSSDTVISSVPTNWNVIGLGDVTGDGRADLIWRNGDTGEVRTWAMVGAINTADRTLATGVGAEWSLQQVADFDGDGKADLLWRSSASGQVRVWTMGPDGHYVADQVVATPALTTKIVGAADFDGDGRADLMLRAADGTNRLWLMNGATVTADLAINTVPTNWTMEAAADFTGDGKADLIWRSTDGAVHMWTMNGATLVADTTLQSLGSAWVLEDAADFTGDGRADLVWQNSTTGEVRLWTMGPAGVIADQQVATVGSSYHIVNLLGG